MVKPTLGQILPKIGKSRVQYSAQDKESYDSLVYTVLHW